MFSNEKIMYFIISYVLSRMVFRQMNFKYDLFVEGFNANKFIIDIGVFGGIYFLVNIIGNKVNKKLIRRNLGGKNESIN